MLFINFRPSSADIQSGCRVRRPQNLSSTTGWRARTTPCTVRIIHPIWFPGRRFVNPPPPSVRLFFKPSTHPPPELTLPPLWPCTRTHTPTEQLGNRAARHAQIFYNILYEYACVLRQLYYTSIIQIGSVKSHGFFFQNFWSRRYIRTSLSTGFFFGTINVESPASSWYSTLKHLYIPYIYILYRRYFTVFPSVVRCSVTQ